MLTKLRNRLRVGRFKELLEYPGWTLDIDSEFDADTGEYHSFSRYTLRKDGWEPLYIQHNCTVDKECKTTYEELYIDHRKGTEVCDDYTSGWYTPTHKDLLVIHESLNYYKTLKKVV